MFRHCLAAIAALFVGVSVLADTPSHDAFTYQGQLKHSGEAVTGPVNFAFRLYDAEMGGGQVGPEIEAPAFEGFDDDGRFTVDLAFGKGVFDGTPLWLEIEVDGTTLEPRQPIMPTPYAVRALNVATVMDGALTGTYSNPVAFTNAGNLFSGSFTGSGAGLSSLNAGSISSGALSAAHAPSGGSWALSTTLNLASNTLVVNPATNRIGIGTASPSSALHVVANTGTRAVQGIHTSGTGINYGGYFETASTSGFGAHGLATAASGSTYGLFGRSESTSGRGVLGQATAATGTTYGVYGQVNSPDGFAGYFLGPEGSRSYFQRAVGIGTSSPSGMLHVIANSGIAVRGVSVNDNALRGEASGTGATAVFAWATAESGSPRGLWARCDSEDGYAGFFSGRAYFSNKVGIGNLTPSSMLSVSGGADFSGSVGIGTDAPTATLHVVQETVGPAIIMPGLRISQNATSPSIVGGHASNTVAGSIPPIGMFIGGGGDTDGPHFAWGSFATIAGGRNNTIGVLLQAGSGTASVIGGGENNFAPGTRCTIAGGRDNVAGQIVGGFPPSISTEATVGGGRENVATATHSTIGGGFNNTASGTASTVGGGDSNSATWVGATVGGGVDNVASAQYATVPGGRENSATGSYSFAAGRNAKANHAGSFVLADSNNADFVSNSADRFRALFSNGYQLYTNSAATIGVQVGANGSSWSSISDRNVKHNIMPVDPVDVAHRLAQMPVALWTYIDDAGNVPHMGPMAQDFFSAFGLGDSDRHIATIDADGVLFAAIQGVYQMVQQKDAEIAALRGEKDAELSLLRDEVAQLRAIVGEFMEGKGTTR